MRLAFPASEGVKAAAGQTAARGAGDGLQQKMATSLENIEKSMGQMAQTQATDAADRRAW